MSHQSSHPFAGVAIVGVHNTVQARVLPEHDSTSIALTGALGALADAGISSRDVDGVVGTDCAQIVLELGLGPCTRRPSQMGIPALLDAAALITTGQCGVVLIAAGGAGVHVDRASTAPWTRPTNELVVGYGLFTAAEFALMARRHMLTYGTTPEQLATVSAVVRNNGHTNPEAVYYGRGPFSPADILASRMVADPFHLLDCATTSEGGCALVLTTAERASACTAPVWIIGGASDAFGPAYVVAPVWDFQPRADSPPAGLVGARAARPPLQWPASRPAMSTWLSSTIPSRSRSSGSSRPSASAHRARVARSSRTGTSGRRPLPVTTDGGPCRSATRESTRSNSSG